MVTASWVDCNVVYQSRQLVLRLAEGHCLHAQDNHHSTVRITAPATRAIARMDAKVVDAVLAFIDGPLTDNPMRVTKPLTGELEGKRSGYVGIAFRVLVDVNESQRIVWVLRVAHRADAYRP